MTIAQLHTSRLALEPAHVLTVMIDAQQPMSMALYTQLPRQPLWRRTDDGTGLDWLDPDLTLGTPWGTVLCHPDEDCHSASEHWHVLGVVDGMLVLDVVMGWMTTDRLAVEIEAMPRLVVGL